MEALTQRVRFWTFLGIGFMVTTVVLDRGLIDHPYSTFVQLIYVLSISIALINIIALIARSMGNQQRSTDIPIKQPMCTAHDLDLLGGVLSEQPSNMCAEWRCAICMCDSKDDGEQLRELKRCKHIFHRGCVDQWFLDTPLLSLRCPLCREHVFEY